MQSCSFASRVGVATLAVAAVFASHDAARAADLPEIKVNATNVVPACATPGRLQAYLSKRNATLDPQFTTIAVDYMREGDALGIRWDMPRVRASRTANQGKIISPVCGRSKRTPATRLSRMSRPACARTCSTCCCIAGRRLRPRSRNELSGCRRWACWPHGGRRLRTT